MRFGIQVSPHNLKHSLIRCILLDLHARKVATRWCVRNTAHGALRLAVTGERRCQYKACSCCADVRAGGEAIPSWLSRLHHAETKLFRLLHAHSSECSRFPIGSEHPHAWRSLARVETVCFTNLDLQPLAQISICCRHPSHRQECHAFDNAKCLRLACFLYIEIDIDIRTIVPIVLTCPLNLSSTASNTAL